MSRLSKIQEQYEKVITEEQFQPLIKIADIFARYLVGDKDVAVTQLKATQVQTKVLANMEAGEYNKLYTQLTKDLFNVMKKHMRNVT
jgi:hypothetical protein